jgi:hypothetical protein
MLGSVSSPVCTHDPITSASPQQARRVQSTHEHGMATHTALSRQLCGATLAACAAAKTNNCVTLYVLCPYPPLHPIPYSSTAVGSTHAEAALPDHCLWQQALSWSCPWSAWPAATYLLLYGHSRHSWLQVKACSACGTHTGRQQAKHVRHQPGLVPWLHCKHQSFIHVIMQPAYRKQLAGD